MKNIIIPLGGLGTRFSKKGYKYPKPMVSVIGKNILFWILDSIFKINSPFGEIRIFIPYNKILETYNFESLVTNKYQNLNIQFLKLENDTEGAADTLMRMLKEIVRLSNNDLNSIDFPFLCMDGDSFYHKINIIEKWDEIDRVNCVVCFKELSGDSCYSFIETENNIIKNIKEKNRISNLACSGTYGFSSGKDLYLNVKECLENNIKDKGELYTSTVIQHMISKMNTFKPIIVESKNWICLGTPLQARLFSNNYSAQLCEKKRFCFELDNVLIQKNKKGIFSPIHKNINMVTYLKKFGHHIIIHTTRKMNKSMAIETFDILDQFSIPYDEIIFGKPIADYYIDTKSVSSFDDLEKETGFYISHVVPRDFNALEVKTIELYTKKSVDSLQGEIFYYNNIPTEIKDLFPIMFSFDDKSFKWYEIEKIQSISLSSLFVHQELTPEHVEMVLHALNRLHKQNVDKDEIINIYANYIPKIEKRFKNYNYKKYDFIENSNLIFEELCQKLKEFQNRNMGIQGIIHGDPVCTNILLNDFNKIKFIDMRGEIDNVFTLQGDIFYDFAKFYQSLLGYDEILQEIYVPETYKNNLIKAFKNKFIELYDEEHFEYVKIITKSLLFSLIPLHDYGENEKCFKYFKLMCNG